MSAVRLGTRTIPLRDLLTNAAAFVIIVAGMRAASSLIVLFLLAIFIAVLAGPMFVGMQQRGIPTFLAMMILILGLIVIGTVGVHALRISLEDIYRSLPRYQEMMQDQVGVILVWLENRGVETPDQMIRNSLAEKTPVRMIGDSIITTTRLLGRIFIVLLVAIFILLEASMLPAKLRAMPGMTEEHFQRIKLVIDNVRKYIGMKTIMSLLTGALITGLLFAAGVDYPILLGVLAFLFNFIPNIGSVMAGVPGVFLAFVEYGLGRAIFVGVGYVVINIFVSNVIEPRYMGRGLGLSPTVIVISLIFWAWVLGPIGMLLSVPLTMSLKIAMETLPETRGLAMLVGSHPGEAKPGESGEASGGVPVGSTMRPEG
ncbi:MAG TPA: AI-2E family transporter [Kiritimatiellia bacterium]|nr:AI-2E family transporter [Kiritimatiellia bacterium]